MNNRAPLIDDIRGQAVLWMIIFHAAYDLTLVGVLDYDFTSGFWFWLPRYIVLSFFICVGASLKIAYQREIVWSKFWRRFFKIAVGAIIISIVTYILFPKSWVYFGTLHCIATASLLGLPLVNRTRLALALAVLILVSMPFFGLSFKNLSALASVKSMDFIPIYPWFAAVCLGIFLSDWLKSVQYQFNIPLLKKCSHHAFVIYVIHQPVLYGLSLLIRHLSRP